VEDCPKFDSGEIGQQIHRDASTWNALVVSLYVVIGLDHPGCGKRRDRY
jgi:hypothetical protein